MQELQYNLAQLIDDNETLKKYKSEGIVNGQNELTLTRLPNCLSALR